MKYEETDKKIDRIFNEDATEIDDNEVDYEGQLALDAYQTADNVIIKAPLAGVKPEDINVAMSDNVITIKGQRKEEHEVKKDDYLLQECFWGSFSRSLELPSECDLEKAQATLKNGILIITMPKTGKNKTKVLKINSE